MFPSTFIDSITPVRKSYYITSGPITGLTINNSVATSDYKNEEEKLFLLSYNECHPSGDGKIDSKVVMPVGSNAEGVAYTWFANNDTNAARKLSTRSGGTPSGATDSKNLWWLRSPNTTNDGWVRVNSSGAPNYTMGATNYYGIAPAFCF